MEAVISPAEFDAWHSYIASSLGVLSGWILRTEPDPSSNSITWWSNKAGCYRAATEKKPWRAASGKKEIVYDRRSCSTFTHEIEFYISRGKFKVFFLMSFVWPVELWFIVAWFRKIALPVTKVTVDTGFLKLQGLFRCTKHTRMEFLAGLKEGTGTIVGVYVAGTED